MKFEIIFFIVISVGMFLPQIDAQTFCWYKNRNGLWYQDYCYYQQNRQSASQQQIQSNQQRNSFNQQDGSIHQQAQTDVNRLGATQQPIQSNQQRNDVNENAGSNHRQPQTGVNRLGANQQPIQANQHRDSFNQQDGSNHQQPHTDVNRLVANQEPIQTNQHRDSFNQQDGSNHQQPQTGVNRLGANQQPIQGNQQRNDFNENAGSNHQQPQTDVNRLDASQQPIQSNQNAGSNHQQPQTGATQQLIQNNQQQGGSNRQQPQTADHQQNRQGTNQQPPVTRQQQKYQHYCGYTIAAKIDNELVEVAKRIQRYIKESPSMKKAYYTISPSDYQTTIYTIHQCQSLQPQQCSNVNGQMNKKKCWLPDTTYQSLNNWATCYLESQLSQPLKIKYASLKIGTYLISLRLEFENDIWDKIKNARNELTKAYTGQAFSRQATNEQLYIVIASGNRDTVTVKDLNKLNELVRPFTGGKLMRPSVYLDDLQRYIQFQKTNRC